MTVYSVQYDLAAPGRDYAKVAAGVAKVSRDNVRPLQSCWLVSTSLSSAEIDKIISAHVDSDDRWLVFEAKLEDWIGRRLDPSSEAWLRSHTGWPPSHWLHDQPPVVVPPPPPPDLPPLPPLGALAVQLGLIPPPAPPGLPPIPSESRRLGELAREFGTEPKRR